MLQHVMSQTCIYCAGNYIPVEIPWSANAVTNCSDFVFELILITLCIPIPTTQRADLCCVHWRQCVSCIEINIK